MDITFILLSWNSERYLARCLSCIHEACSENEFSYEILVLDNGSIDGSAGLIRELVAANPGHVVPYFETANIGTTRSRNKLLTDAKGDYICIMDSDVELKKGVVDLLLPILKRNNDLGIVVPRVLYPNGSWQKSYDRFPTIFDKIERFFRLKSIERREAHRVRDREFPFYVDYAISAFWLMRKDTLSKVGLLDEIIFYSPEDIDFCFRVWKTGYRILYVPSVCVIHHTQEISRGIHINKAKLYHIIGLCYYFMKHRYVFRRPKMITQ